MIGPKELYSILLIEPEHWLAYLHGQQLDKLPHLKKSTRKIKGYFLNFIYLLFFCLKKLTILRRNIEEKNLDVVVFGDTNNQLSALDSTVNHLKRNNKKLIVITSGINSRIFVQDTANIEIKLYFRDIVYSIYLLLIRFKALQDVVRSQYQYNADWCLRSFLVTYPYLVYFARTLSEFNPKIVLVSNDHNIANRCLLAVARYLGIKTAYMQHASVSDYFPALAFDYAFLDGQHSLQRYEACHMNRPPTLTTPHTVIVLSGQKKYLRTDNSSINKVVIGLALNPLDDYEAAMQLVDKLLTAGHEVCIRPHPGSSRGLIRKLEGNLERRLGATLSDPFVMSVSSYLSRIRCLIAGNSSIHLEAALAGVFPIYFEFSATEISDYYGYVKNGLVQVAHSSAELLHLLADEAHAKKMNIEAVQYYSSTYGTEWQGREGAMVAEYLVSAVEGLDRTNKGYSNQ